MATPQEMFDRPLNASLAQNRPIGTGATYSGLQDTSSLAMAMQQNLASLQGSGNINDKWPNGNWLTINNSGHTLRDVTYYSASGTGTPNFFPVSIRVPPGPWDSLIGSGDCGCLILDAAGADPYRMIAIYRFNRNFFWTGDSGRADDIRSAGHAPPGISVPARFGTTAGGPSYVFGTIRKAEVDARVPWRHALHMVLPRYPSHPGGPRLSRRIQWPCSADDWDANNPDNNTGAIPYGGLLAIPPVSKGGPNLDTLGLTPLGRILYECMRDYGAYVNDGGANANIRCDSTLASGDWSDIRAALRNMWQYCRVVTNSVPDATAQRIINGGYTGQIGTPTYPAGGGDPIAPNMAFDADGNGGTTPPAEPQMATSMGAVVRRIVPA